MAIARDTFAALASQGNVSTWTNSYTCSGSDRLLLVCVTKRTNDDVTGVTHGGVAMTQLVKLHHSGGTEWLYIYGLINPATGAQNIVMSASGSSVSYYGATSYTGVSQSGNPTITGSSTTNAISLTSTVDNSTMFVFVQNSVDVVGSDTGSTLISQANGTGMLESNPLQINSAGSKTMNYTGTSNNSIGVIFAPSNPFNIISFDASASGSTSSTSLTYSHTCSGNRRFLFVLASAQNAGSITGVTYNGVAMTFLNSLRSGTYGEVYYLINPASGTHNVVISANTSTAIKGLSSSYNGTDVAPEATATNTANTSGTLTTNITTLTSGAYLVGFSMFDGSPTMQAGTGATERVNTGSSATAYPCGIFDSNGQKGAPGSYSMSVSPVSGSGNLDLRLYSLVASGLPIASGAGFFNTMIFD